MKHKIKMFLINITTPSLNNLEGAITLTETTRNQLAKMQPYLEILKVPWEITSLMLMLLGKKQTRCNNVIPLSVTTSSDHLQTEVFHLSLIKQAQRLEDKIKLFQQHT